MEDDGTFLVPLYPVRLPAPRLRTPERITSSRDLGPRPGGVTVFGYTSKRSLYDYQRE